MRHEAEAIAFCPVRRAGSALPDGALLVSARPRVSLPALERGASEEGDLPAGGDPVTSAQLAHDTHKLTRTRSFAARDQLVGPPLDLPAARVQGAQHERLLLGGHVEPMPAGPL